MSAVKSWSYTAYSTYAQCPAKYKYQKIDKLPEPKSQAMERGNAIHKKCENYLTGITAALPTEAKHFAAQMQQLKTLDPFVEQKWGFTKDWRPTSWTGSATWYRGIVDAGVLYPDRTADIVDFKTGKLYETNEDQIELFALSVMLRYPEITHVTARLWYLDSGDEIIREHSASDKEALRKDWEKRVGPMFADTIFAPKPNKFCDWCHFRKSNGGPCRFS